MPKLCMDILWVAPGFGGGVSGTGELWEEGVLGRTDDQCGPTVRHLDGPGDDIVCVWTRVQVRGE